MRTSYHKAELRVGLIDVQGVDSNGSRTMKARNGSSLQWRVLC